MIGPESYIKAAIMQVTMVQTTQLSGQLYSTISTVTIIYQTHIFNMYDPQTTGERKANNPVTLQKY